MKTFAAIAIALAIGFANTSEAASRVTPSIIIATTGGTVTEGARSVTFVAGTGFTGTIMGTVVTASAPGIPIPFVSTVDHALVAIPYTISAGTLYIFVTR